MCMGKPVSSNMKRVETAPLSTKVNKEVLDNFKSCCAYLGYPMNVMLETFMFQYSNGRFPLSGADIVQWKDDTVELGALSTTFNKNIYEFFSARDNSTCQDHMVTAFVLI